MLEKNLEGWVAEAKFRARNFVRSDDGSRILKAFDLVDHAKALIGDDKSRRVLQVLHTLQHECAKAIAEQMPQSRIQSKNLR